MAGVVAAVVPDLATPALALSLLFAVRYNLESR